MFTGHTGYWLTHQPSVNENYDQRFGCQNLPTIGCWRFFGQGLLSLLCLLGCTFLGGLWPFCWAVQAVLLVIFVEPVYNPDWCLIQDLKLMLWSKQLEGCCLTLPIQPGTIGTSWQEPWWFHHGRTMVLPGSNSEPLTKAIEANDQVDAQEPGSRDMQDG